MNLHKLFALVAIVTIVVPVNVAFATATTTETHTATEVTEVVEETATEEEVVEETATEEETSEEVVEESTEETKETEEVAAVETETTEVVEEEVTETVEETASTSDDAVVEEVVVATTYQSSTQTVIAPTVPVCPIAPADGRIIADFTDNGQDQFLLSDPQWDEGHTEIEVIDVPAGTYEIRLIGWDGNVDRPSHGVQAFESYQLAFVDGTTEIARSSETTDLADGVIEADVDEVVDAAFELTTAATGIQAVHAYFGETSSPNSIWPICISLDPIVADVPGCTDATATNYDANATVDDGSCAFDTPVEGCTDSTANNFNANATVDDGSCTYDQPVEGCTDATATNYDANATVDDGSCEYEEVTTTTRSGGGGSVSLRCELTVTDDVITAGEEITLTWDTRGARELTLTANGVVILNTEENLDFDSSLTLAPVVDTTYELTVDRGSRDRVCTIDVDVAEVITAVPTAEPLVAGIALSDVPHTGFGDTALVFAFYMLLGGWSLVIAYAVITRKTTSAFTPNIAAMKRAQKTNPHILA